MSETSQGPGWWMASDSKWYPPESHPSFRPPGPPPSKAPRFAGWGARVGAFFIDAAIMWVAALAYFAFIGGLLPTEVRLCTLDSGEVALCEQFTTTGQLLFALLMLIWVAIGFWYYGWNQGKTGQTLGKRALGIRVVDERTLEPIGPGRGIGRYLANILSALPLFLGYLWPLWDDRNQTFHDKIVGSLVLRG